MSTWTDPELTPDEQEDLDAILALDWSPQEMTFGQVQRYMDQRRRRSAAAIAKRGKIRCKCGTEMMIGPGKGPHAAKAICPVCDRKWWLKEEDLACVK